MVEAILVISVLNLVLQLIAVIQRERTIQLHKNNGTTQESCVAQEVYTNHRATQDKRKESYERNAR